MMTMRTVFHYVCQNGHAGKYVESENDAPYSKEWHSTRLEGMHEARQVPGGVPYPPGTEYACATCKSAMGPKTR